ncbi:fatty-acid amide hydrolase 2 [Arctopsyche grandis]|uniref:fatty-acid amide hydrolase 2 n=1 Tax=Arctopsyche grandis TaxID=121162 RepID=UPI00406D7BF8
MSNDRPKRSSKKVNKLVKGMSLQILIQILLWMRTQFDTLVDFLFSLYWDPKKEIIPPLDKNTKVLLESATSLATKIRNRQLKSVDLVKLFIDRIKVVNPIINAVTDERYEDALKDAKEVDKLIESGISEDVLKKKPFLGVPFTSKESYAVAGMLHTIGLVARRTCKAEVDAEAIKLMKDAGAILIAVSNVPEVNKWQETRNMLFGQTCNPYHCGRTVGGSSGGEAALVSSVCSPIGLCSDIGGSTRMPAYYCGLFGHHPTADTTNMRGGTFRTGLEKNTMVSAGALVKHAEDIAPLLKVLANEKADLLKLDAHVDLNKLKYYFVDRVGDKRCSNVQLNVKECMDKVIENLSETVAAQNPPVRIQLEGFQYMYRLWRYWMTKEPADFPYLLGNMQSRVNGLVELFKKLVGCSEYTFAGIMGLLDCQVLPQEKESWALPVYDKLKRELLEILGSDGVLIFYSAPQTAPYHYTPIVRPFNFGYWCIFNALRFPVTQVPLGLDDEGLPLGIQVVSAPFNDRLCIAVAKHLEESFGGYVPTCNTIS